MTGANTLQHPHDPAAALLRSLGLPAGITMSALLTWRLWKPALDALARLSAWRKARQERAISESAAHEANVIAAQNVSVEAQRVEDEADRAERDRLETKAARLDNYGMRLIEKLQEQVNAQEARISQIEEAAKLSALTAEAAHMRADDSDARYLTAKTELAALKLANALLSQELHAARADKEGDRATIAELTRHVGENMTRIEALEAELAKHRQAAYKAAEITLHDSDGGG